MQQVTLIESSPADSLCYVSYRLWLNISVCASRGKTAPAKSKSPQTMRECQLSNCIQQIRIHTNHGGVPGISPSKANNHKNDKNAPNSSFSKNTHHPQPPILIPSPYTAGPCNYTFRFADSSCAPHLCPEPVPWHHRHRHTD